MASLLILDVPAGTSSSSRLALTKNSFAILGSLKPKTGLGLVFDLGVFIDFVGVVIHLFVTQRWNRLKGLDDFWNGRKAAAFWFGLGLVVFLIRPALRTNGLGLLQVVKLRSALVTGVLHSEIARWHGRFPFFNRL
jgi:hypothetical protein